MKRVTIFLTLIAFSLLGLWYVFGRLFLLVGCLYAAWHVWKHRKELENIRFQDVINPLKWGSVLFASFMKMMFPLHIVEQLILRMYDMQCRKCVAKGSCEHCGCDIAKVYTPWDVCSDGNWGVMVENKREYEKIREEFPVEIIIRYTKEGL